MNHSFNTEIADMYGVNEAILIENIYFWVSKNKANGKHYHDGKYWTYNSTKAFSELFYYWSESQIERIIKSLVDKNVIEIGNYNEMKFDRTRWISLNESVCSIYRNHKMDLTESTKGFNEIATTIPDINTNINTDIVFAPSIAVVDKKIKSIPPAIEQVEEYCLGRNNGISGQAFVDFYEARGWIVGKKKMVDWKAAVRTWENNRKSNPLSSKPCISEGKKIDGGWQL